MRNLRDVLKNKERPVYCTLPPKLKEEFDQELSELNFGRMLIINKVTLLLMIAFFPLDYLNYNYGWGIFTKYHYSTHLLMFVVAFIINVFIKPNKAKYHFNTKKIMIIAFLIFFTLSCTTLSILDQLTHQQLTSYTIGLFTISVMIILNPLTSLGICLINYLVFMLGMTLIDINISIKSGHYINGTAVLIVSWVVSQSFYSAKIRSFLNRKTIEVQTRKLTIANEKLEHTNQKLTDANQKLQESLLALDETHNMVFTLALALESKDTYTMGHSSRVADDALKLAQYLELSEEEQVLVYRAGILHDLGKIGIPDAILNKSSALTEEEWAIMKSHPVRGETICSRLKFAKEVLPMIRHHHERYDGKGYPDGLKGEEIPLLARIISIVDTADAIMSKRPYREAGTYETVIEELQKYSGTQFDPKIVNAYIEMCNKELELSSL